MKKSPPIFIKPGVELDGLKAVMWGAATLVAEIFDEFEIDCVITDALRAPAAKASYHAEGLALDFRGKHVAPHLRKVIETRLTERLGHPFDVVAHGEGDNFHYHVEYDRRKAGE